jgi:cytochrome c nitrite reductase small subunit
MTRQRVALASWVVGGLIGAAAGVGSFTFLYAEGASYLGHDSAACANCHVMNEQYDAWLKSSHRAVAECNDCHTPHDLVPKYAVKAINGFNHSLAFTTGWFHEPIRIKGFNRVVTENSCRHCHGDVVAAMDGGGHGGAQADAVSCVRCHGKVGHPDLTTSASALRKGGRP